VSDQLKKTPNNPPSPGRRRLSLDRYVDGVLRGDRMILARAITVVESDLPADGELSALMLARVLPHSGK
jgi:LAO/AO transport system kinase